MTYTDCSRASQFRILINVNFVWDYLRKHDFMNYQELNVPLLAEQLEDCINTVDLLRYPAIKVDTMLRKLIARAYK